MKTNTIKPKKCLKQKIDEASKLAEDLQREVHLVLKIVKEEAKDERTKAKRLNK